MSAVDFEIALNGGIWLVRVGRSGLDGGEGVYHGNSRGRSELKGCRGDWGVGLFAGEGEVGFGAVGFLDIDGSDDAVGGHGEGETLDALFLAVRDAGKCKGAVSGRCRGEVIDLFLKLGMAEEEAERRAEIVELLGTHALDLRVTPGVEPGVFAVEKEELAGGAGVVPAHAAGLEEQERTAFNARAAHSFVVFGELGFEGVELVVVMIDALGEVVGGRLLGVEVWGEQRCEKEGEENETEVELSELVSHPSRKRRGLDGAPNPW